MANPDASTIAIRLEQLSDLFDSFDPAPRFRQRLSPDVMDYLVKRAGESGAGPLKIELHLPAGGVNSADSLALSAAISAAFRAEEAREHAQRKELFAEGRWLLAIGAAVVVAGAIAMWAIDRFVEIKFLSNLAQSVFVIIAWVIVWRPAELYLYDWLPIRQQKQLFARLAAAPVAIVPRRD